MMDLTHEVRAELRRLAGKSDIASLINVCAAAPALLDALEAAERFKGFVHSYLDSHGVPHGDPDNAHQKEGCRIGARLDLLLSKWKATETKTIQEEAAPCQ